MEVELEERLIEEVKKYECLYNLMHPDYKKIDRKEAVWLEVAQALNVTPDLAKRKWRNIRDYYYQIKRAEKLSSGSGAVAKKKWKHMESCSFLNTVPKIRPTLGCIPSGSDEPEPPPIIISDSESSPTNHTPSKTAGQRKADDFREFLQSATNSIKNTCQAMQAAVCNNSNSMTVFFNSMATDIAEANFSQVELNDIKMKISAIVYEKIASKNN